MSTWASVAVLMAAGFLAAVINVIAGGGSFLTLPALIFMGLPAAEANGTNRLGVVAQSVAAVWGFHRHGVLEWRRALIASLPASAAAAVGAWLALAMGDREFRRLLALLMVAITLWTLFDPRARGESDGSKAHAPARPAVVMAGWVVVGLYGGLVQAGVGFLILAVTTLAGLDLVRGNAVKVVVVLLLTAVSLAIFAWDGKVQWLEGLALAAGSVLGSLLGVRLTVVKGHRWVRGVVTATVIAFAVKLWLD